MKKIGILIFEDVEELDFVGPLEVFGMAGRLGGESEIFIIAPEATEVRCRYGLRVRPQLAIEQAPKLDLLIVPGGLGARTHARENPRILEFVRRQEGLTASVCTGALILGSAGVLRGRRATTHHSAVEALASLPGVRWEKTRVVFDEPIVSSAGVSAGIDLALALVARFWGAELAEKVAQQIEWEQAAGPALGGEWRDAPQRDS
jgi:transcriptional regulator GlxA family with amidase domain